MGKNNLAGLIGLGVIGVFCLCCGGCGIGWINGGVEFSEGYREGTVQKFSRKGIIWKTDEGELAMAGFQSTGGEHPTMSNVFPFTVSDAKIKDEIKALRATDKVRLYYKQYYFSPAWHGETGYFIYKVERIHE